MVTPKAQEMIPEQSQEIKNPNKMLRALDPLLQNQQEHYSPPKD